MITFTFLNETSLRVPRAALQKVARAASQEFRIRKSCTVNVVVTRAAQTKKLNKKYRGKNYIPDVLTFEYPGNESILGEIVITESVLQKQAKERKHSLSREFTILAVHGIVHMMGFEHEGVSERKKTEMRRHESNIFRKLKLSPEF